MAGRAGDIGRGGGATWRRHKGSSGGETWRRLHTRWWRDVKEALDAVVARREGGIRRGGGDVRATLTPLPWCRSHGKVALTPPPG